MKSFQYYDPMYPSQDTAEHLGNLIALPLQGRALKNGNSAFVDHNWNAYPDQWDILFNHMENLSADDIEKYMAKWQTELSEERGMAVPAALQSRPKPWKKKEGFIQADVVGKMHIVLGDGVYVDTLNLMPRLQNQIRSMAAFDNPVFFLLKPVKMLPLNMRLRITEKRADPYGLYLMGISESDRVCGIYGI